MKIGIGLPVSRLYDFRAAMSITHAVVDAARNGYQVEVISEGNHERPLSIVEARNRISMRAIEVDVDYLLWLDSDATIVPGMLPRLLSRDVPIVQGLCFKRKHPTEPACGIKGGDDCAMDFPPPIAEIAAWIDARPEMALITGAALLPDEDGALLPVDVVGTHFTLIKRAVFDVLPYPWYVRTTPPDSGSTGSDWYFCKQAQDAGFASYTDLSAVSGHLEGSHCISVADFVRAAVFYQWAEGKIK